MRFTHDFFFLHENLRLFLEAKMVKSNTTFPSQVLSKLKGLVYALKHLKKGCQNAVKKTPQFYKPQVRFAQGYF